MRIFLALLYSCGQIEAWNPAFGAGMAGTIGHLCKRQLDVGFLGRGMFGWYSPGSMEVELMFACNDLPTFERGANLRSARAVCPRAGSAQPPFPHAVPVVWRWGRPAEHKEVRYADVPVVRGSGSVLNAPCPVGERRDVQLMQAAGTSPCVVDRPRFQEACGIGGCRVFPGISHNRRSLPEGSPRRA